jgi:hypothetical protein
MMEASRKLLYYIANAMSDPTVDELSSPSRSYWRRTREEFLGGKLEDVCPKSTAKWDEAWVNVQKGL